MAGDVGRAVVSMPGYGGYIPSYRQPVIPLHTAVAERVAASKRHGFSQPPKRAVGGVVLSPLSSSSRFGDENEDGVLPSDSLFLQKRTATGTTTYLQDYQRPPFMGSPTSSPKFTRAKKLLLGGTASGSVTPENEKRFTATSESQTANTVVLAEPPSRSFYSDRLKAQIANGTAGQLLSSTGTNNSPLKRSRATKSGTSGTGTEGQPQGQDGEQQQEQKPRDAYLSITRQTLNGPFYDTARDIVKLDNPPTFDSSYQTEYGKHPGDIKKRFPMRTTDFCDRASTTDLFAGTTKALPQHRLPGYMGHVPVTAKNVQKVNGDADLLVGHHKANLLFTTNAGCLPGYAGHQPKSIFNNLGHIPEPDPNLTTYGRVSQQVHEYPEERAMNTREHANSHAMKCFFTRGGGEDSALISDLYYQRFRPYEGQLRHGSAKDAQWINDSQLHRSYITNS